MGFDLGKKKKRGDRMDLPHLIAEQFCISSASVLSFLENLTICFSNHGLKNTGENHRPLHQMCLLSLKCRRDPLSAFDKLWNWKANYSHIFTQIWTAFWKLCKSEWMRNNSFTQSESRMPVGVLMNSIFKSCTKSLDIYFHLGLRLSQLFITDTDFSSFSEGPSADSTAWQFCCLLS